MVVTAHSQLPRSEEASAVANLMPLERIQQRIYWIRGQKVMLSPDLAELYGVGPRALVQAAVRNRARFPADFRFRLTSGEVAMLDEARCCTSKVILDGATNRTGRDGARPEGTETHPEPIARGAPLAHAPARS